MAEKSTDTSPGEPMARPGQAAATGNWWDSWITSAKTKSAEVYTMVKKDLDEIGSAVKSEASHVLNSTSTAIGKTLKLDEPESPANVMKKSFSTFIGQVSTVLNPEPDDEDDTEVILSSGDTTMLSTYKKELEALQRVDATFIVPANSPEFEAWRASLELSDSAVISAAAAAKRLAGSPLLRSQYDRLVPDAVGCDDFWERYLFRVALLQDRLAAASRRQPQEEPSTDPVLANLPMQTPPPPPPDVILESPKKAISTLDMDEPDVTPEIDDAVAWEDEDFAKDLELTEEQQTLLLEEYEREIADKKLTKQTSTKDIVNNNLKNKTTNTKAGIKKPQQTRDKLNNKPATDKTNPKAATDKPSSKVTDKSNKPSTDKLIRPVKKAASKTAKPTKKAGKPDVCGNDLVEDYFGDKEPQKDDASSNSDESWEKEFEIEDVEQKA